jgi:hypothetical protein
MTVVLAKVPYVEGLREAANAVAALYPNEPATIWLGAHAIAPGSPEPGEKDIIYQTECAQSQWFRPRDPKDRTTPYLQRLARVREVWDFSLVNMSAYEARAKRWRPLRWTRELETMPQLRHVPRDIDVGFYGSLSDRRRRILGAGVKLLPWKVGFERDRWIARCKVIVVPHFYDGPAAVEQPRVAHLLANSVAVVAEHALDESDYPGPLYATAENMVSVARRLARSGDWAELGADGYRAFRQARLPF